MLVHLSIRNYLLVESVELDFAPGLTVLTGETGAGKSILVDALALALGDRAEGGMVRSGAPRAEISAEFAIDGLPALAAWLDEAGFASDDGTLILRRVIEAGGRSRAFINGSAAPLSQLKDAAEYLLDIHGQHAHHALLRPQAQREALDAYAGAQSLVAAVNTAWHAWQAVRQRRQDAETHSQARQIEREGLTLAVEELRALGDDLARWDEIQAEHARLAHVTTLIESSQALIDGLDEGEAALSSRLGEMCARLDAMQAVDGSLGEVATLLNSASADLAEAVHALRRYADHLNLDPDRLAELDRVLGDMHRLARKHRVQPEALAGLLDRFQARLDELAASDDLDALQAAENAVRTHYESEAKRLGAQRRKAATALSKQVTAAMHELALAGGHLDIELQPVSEPRAHGLEDVRFLVASHPGLPSGPLGKVASGGELSRVSLAIQTALSGVAGVPTLIFDEVDVGIGGSVAEAVGRRLARLGETRQVLVITHLPQVAARGTQHLRVAKQANGRFVSSNIAVLDADARVEEIARMLGGLKITATTRQHAAEMLAG
ncbi:DNA repair protein RecN [Thiobacillus sp.]|uniref:DNA repair protein RecN n=1 Tax=Thiobacillus sp. TaxID=924 RepID=UPI0017DFA215|nr:DNA repair protein RecN [Thiobacillus sp.]MBC2730754.1 DNA repair protein RecN [Thiobacillus sp.]MBC2739491.1 DNA repair protein RecN [Thiobacillus sp.]MBC2760226.1 DNA repair protein RecN [Thiobacillus sp.]